MVKPDIRTAALAALAALVALVSVVAASRAPAQGSASQDSLAVARKYAEWFFTAQKDSLWAHSSEGIRKQAEKPDWWLEGLQRLTGRAGTEEKVIEEKFVRRNGERQYWRTSKYSLMSEPVMLRFVLLPDMTIGGLGMNPQSEAPPIDPIK